jgi:hypothetical protein
MPPAEVAERPLFSLGEIRREREIDGAIYEALAENTPQSMLRDLHRPVKEWQVGLFGFDKHEIPKDGGRDAHRAVKQAYLTSYRIPIQELANANQMWQSGWAELRSLLTGPWKESPRLGQPRQTFWLTR